MLAKEEKLLVQPLVLAAKADDILELLKVSYIHIATDLPAAEVVEVATVAELHR